MQVKGCSIYRANINSAIQLHLLAETFWANLVGFGNLGKIKILQFAQLFDKLPRPRDSEVAFSVFESRCYLLLSV